MMDYILTNIINNYKDEDGLAKYDYVSSIIWFSKQELCDEVGKFLNMYIPLEVKVSVSRKQLESVRKLLSGRKLSGMYGDDFLNEW
jgi:hypothetical protein